MNRIDRLTAMILLLQSHRVVTAEQIAAHFELSVRTVYRDIAALGEAGVPIAAEAGVSAWIHGVYKERLTDDNVARLAAFGIPMTPTMVVFKSYAEIGRGRFERDHHRLDRVGYAGAHLRDRLRAFQLTCEDGLRGRPSEEALSR